MKVGVSGFAWSRQFALSQLDLLSQLRTAGLDGYEIPMFDPTDLPTKNIRAAFEANGLECTVCAILPKDINPISPDASIRRKALDHLVTCVEMTGEL